MKKAIESPNPSDESAAEKIGNVIAIPKVITLVCQRENHSSGVLRFFFAQCVAGGKYLRPLGLGAGVPVQYCVEESEAGRIATRKKLVSNRDPYETTRERAEANLKYYCLPRRDRYDLSLLTRDGQRALWSELEPGTRAVFIDSLEGFTKVAGKDAAGTSVSVPLAELLERLTARDIAVVIFAKAQGNRKEPPAWLDGLSCNMVHIEEDRKNPMQGGARLNFERDLVNELDRAPRRFTWWWKVDEDHKLEFSYREEDFAVPLTPNQQKQKDRHDSIKVMIDKGVPTQKEMADRLGVNASTICHDVEKLVERGEIIKDVQTGKLSLPSTGAPTVEGTDNSGDEVLAGS